MPADAAEPRRSTQRTYIQSLVWKKFTLLFLGKRPCWYMSHMYGASYFHEQFLCVMLSFSQYQKTFGKYYTDVLSPNYGFYIQDTLNYYFP